jgi:hypothetical protein
MQLAQIRRFVPLAALLAALVLAGTAQVASAVAPVKPDRPIGADDPVAKPKPPQGPIPPGWPGPVDQCSQLPDEDFGKPWYANEAKATANRRAAGRWLRGHPKARKALAGRWFSISSRHGAYHLAFTRNAAAYQEALRKVVPHPDRLCARPALYSSAELAAAQRRVERDWDRLARRGVLLNELGVDIPDNTLVVGIDRSSRGDAAQVLRRRYAGRVAMRVEFVEPATALDDQARAGQHHS